jgi:hypothetical protein
MTEALKAIRNLPMMIMEKLVAVNNSVIAQQTHPLASPLLQGLMNANEK